MDKNQIRKLFSEKRASLSESENLKLSQKALAKLVAQEDYQKARDIFAFVSMGSEINTHIAIDKFLADGKRVYVPLTEKGSTKMVFSRLESLDDLEEGNFGVLEPKPSKRDLADNNAADLVIVPGLAFDKNGYRTGYGGGFYDRFFASLDKAPVKIGYCFSFQIVEEDLPTNEFDIPVDYIITD